MRLDYLISKEALRGLALSALALTLTSGCGNQRRGGQAGIDPSLAAAQTAYYANRFPAATTPVTNPNLGRQYNPALFGGGQGGGGIDRSCFPQGHTTVVNPEFEMVCKDGQAVLQRRGGCGKPACSDGQATVGGVSPAGGTTANSNGPVAPAIPNGSPNGNETVDTAPRWLQICDEWNKAHPDKILDTEVTGDNSNDLDGDGIPNSCDEYLVKKGYPAGERNPNGWLVAIQKLDLKDLQEKVASEVIRLDSPEDAAEINKQMGDKRKGFLGLGGKRSLLNNTVGALIAAETLRDKKRLPKERDTAIVTALLAAAIPQDAKEPTIPLANITAFPNGVTTLPGGRGEGRALIFEPGEHSGEFRMASLSGVLNQFSTLADNEAVLYVAEAFVRSPYQVKVFVANSMFNRASGEAMPTRPAGVFVAFLGDELLGYALDIMDLPPKIQKTLDKPKADYFGNISGGKKKLTIMMLTTEVFGAGEADKVPHNHLLMSFAGESIRRLPTQEIASMGEFENDITTSVILTTLKERGLQLKKEAEEDEAAAQRKAEEEAAAAQKKAEASKQLKEMPAGD